MHTANRGTALIRWRPAGMLVFTLLVGCTVRPAIAPADLHPVKGQVVDGSTPVKGGSVSFRALDNAAPPIVNSAVNDKGQFTLVTIQDGKPYPGAPVGKYLVIYTLPNAEFGKGAEPITLAEPVEIVAGAADLTLDISRKQ